MPKIKRITSLLLMAIITFGACVSLCGCTKKLKEDEAISKVSELMEKAYELNVIVFGDGLEYIDTEESKNARYALVKENEKYNSIKDIRQEIDKVFSSGYSTIMENTAFVGLSGGISGTSTPARYIENSNGFLVLKDTDKNPVGIEVKKYDTTTIEIEKISRRFIEAYITSQDKETTILVTLILEDGNWRIDSPTY